MKDNDCKYMKKCELVREFCKQIELCESKYDQSMHIKTKRGKSPCQKYVFVVHQKGEKFFIRSFTKPKLTAKNTEFSQKAASINLLWNSLPTAVKDDLREYTNILKTQKPKKSPFTNSRSIFYKALSKNQTEINNLQDLSQIFGNNISEWIKRGFLEGTKTNQKFLAPILP